MTENVKQFLEADAMRTQGEQNAWPNQNYVMLASRIAPDIRAMQDELQTATNRYKSLQIAFEQVCEAAESAITRLEEFDSVMVRHNLLYASPTTRKRLSDSLTAAAPYRKQGGE